MTRRKDSRNKEGNFASRQCFQRYRIRRYLAENCGVFKRLVEEYLDGAASIRYREIAAARVSIAPFFRYLDLSGISSVESVTPKTITDYILWSKKTRSRDVGIHITFISGFFKWAVAMGYREAGNPVINKLHCGKKTKKAPRPYSDEEMDRTWHYLNVRGNARLRFATAIGEEAGLRIREVCNLRLEDIDIERGQCVVRTPNKSSRARVAFFSEKTKFFYEEWMKERRGDVAHDHVLHGKLGQPSTPSSLRDEFNSVLCKSWHGKPANEIGFDTWSFHRLRHTMASRLAREGADAAVVMACGGWTTFTAMEYYAKVSSEAHRGEYHQAMRRAEEQKATEPATRVLSPAELLARRTKSVVKKQLAHHSERCV
ncbi:MAG: site-specific integrase [Candidatus Sulfotelmatobacter sp.]